MSEVENSEASTWAEIAGPTISKLHASAALGTKVEINPQGCIALALLLASMARKLDTLEGNYEPLDNQT